jgi:RNA polymerase sigma-70 factor, ECF subfamily
VTHRLGFENLITESNEAVTGKPLAVSRTKDHVRSNTARKMGTASCKAAATPGQVQRRGELEEMFVALRSRFVAVAYSVLQNREDAEEAVQEAFLSAHCHLRNFEGRSALKTWLTRIVLNSALMMRRKRKSVATNSLSDTPASQDEDWIEKIQSSHPNPEVIHAERETFEFIDSVLGTMRPTLRQAFTMAYYDDFSREEASEALRVSVATIKARLLRARQQVLDKSKRAHVTPLHRMSASSSKSWKRIGLQNSQAPRAVKST